MRCFTPLAEWTTSQGDWQLPGFLLGARSVPASLMPGNPQGQGQFWRGDCIGFLIVDV